jgi:hypothetical protein
VFALSIVAANPEVLSTWTEDAILLLKPALGVMARPVVVNNLKRAVADLAHPTEEEIHTFLDKVLHGIKTFASQAQAESLTAQLRTLILQKRFR